MQNNTADRLFDSVSQLEENTPLIQKKRFIRLSLWVLLLVVSLAIFLINWGLNNKQESLENALENRLEALAKGRVDVISVWLAGIASQGNRIIHSDLFRLYAAETDLIEEDLSLLLTAPLTTDLPANEEVRQLAVQLPMMQNLLREFTQYSGFLSGRIVNRSGLSYIATDAGTKPLDKQQARLVQQTLTENRVIYSPASASGNGLIMQIYMPILPPQIAGQAEQPVAVLQLSKNISGKINEILSASPLTGKGEQTRLLQGQDAEYTELVPWLPGELFPLQHNLGISEEQALSFAKRNAPREQRSVYSLALKVPELDWWVMQEADPAAAMAPLNEYRRITISLVILGSLLFVVLVGALWWRLIGVENQKMAERFKQLALRIEEQRQLLDSINGTLTEYIGLKDNSGQYRYVNPAFAEAVGRTQDELIGLDDTAIFGFDTAKRLEKSDRRVIESRSHDTVHQEIYLQSKRHDLQISKMPFIDPDGNLSGIVATFRDVTELLENQRRSERATRQTIEVLARAIELNDPYLAGHSRLMSALAVETAKNLGCTEEISKTVETASFLSQIGKMFVDQELLQKPGILTDEEKAEVEKHVEYSANILREIEFDLPIFDSIIQMNEFLDGSGYPAGLKGDEISLPARILAATNSFCAMVKPRSYRPAKSLEDVLSILDSVPDKYDPEIIQALRSATDSVNGKKILIELV
jgi:PAS domain S-box-containing protein